VQERKWLTCGALPVEMTENEKAAEYDKNVEYGDEHRGHGLWPIILREKAGESGVAVF
jgi:hypothetical protein